MLKKSEVQLDSDHLDSEQEDHAVLARCAHRLRNRRSRRESHDSLIAQRDNEIKYLRIHIAAQERIASHRQRTATQTISEVQDRLARVRLILEEESHSSTVLQARLANAQRQIRVQRVQLRSARISAAARARLLGGASHRIRQLQQNLF